MSASAQKITKPDAFYEERARITARVRCGSCAMFDPPRACTLVAGDISAAGICAFYDEKREQV